MPPNIHNLSQWIAILITGLGLFILVGRMTERLDSTKKEVEYIRQMQVTIELMRSELNHLRSGYIGHMRQYHNAYQAPYAPTGVITDQH